MYPGGLQTHPAPGHAGRRSCIVYIGLHANLADIFFTENLHTNILYVIVQGLCYLVYKDLLNLSTKMSTLFTMITVTLYGLVQ